MSISGLAQVSTFSGQIVSSAQWAYVYRIKGRYDERESDDDADRDHLNEASRGLYFDEIKAEMARISKGGRGVRSFTSSINSIAE